MNCGWIRTGKKYVTSCGWNSSWHRGYLYCPFCGKIIKPETAYDRCEKLLLNELAKGVKNETRKRNAK